MTGRAWASVLMAAVFLLSCREMDELDQRRLQEDRIQALMDQREYSKVIAQIEKRLDSHEEDHLWQEYRLEAYLGLGGFELSQLVHRVRSEQPPVTAQRFQAINQRCPVSPWNTKNQVALPCVLLRLAEHLPDMNSVAVQKALELFENKLDAFKSEQQQLLMQTVYLSAIIQSSAEVFRVYAQFRNSFERQHYEKVFDQVTQLARWVDRTLKQWSVLDMQSFARLAGQGAPLLFEHADQETVFLEESAIPTLLRISDLERRELQDRTARVFILHELDTALRESFLDSEDESW